MNISDEYALPFFLSAQVFSVLHIGFKGFQNYFRAVLMVVGIATVLGTLLWPFISANLP